MLGKQPKKLIMLGGIDGRCHRGVTSYSHKGAAHLPHFFKTQVAARGTAPWISVQRDSARRPQSVGFALRALVGVAAWGSFILGYDFSVLVSQTPDCIKGAPADSTPAGNRVR